MPTYLQTKCSISWGEKSPVNFYSHVNKQLSVDKQLTVAVKWA